MEKTINTFFFVKQGKSKASVTFDSNVFKANDTTRIKVEIDNSTCEKDITKVKVKLRRAINTKDKRNRTFYENEVLAVSEYGGVKAGESKSMDVALKMT